MWRHTGKNSLEDLEPASVVDRQVLYRLVRNELAQRFPSRAEAVSRMALIAVRHLSGEGQRILIRGPAGSGKRSLVRALVAILDLPFVELDVAALAETNWAGADLPFFLDRLRVDLLQRCDPDQVPGLAERACILVTHLDRARLATSYASASSRDHRLGKQQALAQLVQAAPVPVSPSTGSGFIWKGDRALIVVTAELQEIQAERPASADLEAWGMLPDLARAIASGVFLSVEAPTQSEVQNRLRSDLVKLKALFLQYGYQLRVEEQVVRYIAEIIVDGSYGGDVAAGTSWITAAVESALVRLLDTGAKSGTVWVLARDDISLPDPPKGVWRE